MANHKRKVGAGVEMELCQPSTNSPYGIVYLEVLKGYGNAETEGSLVILEPLSHDEVVEMAISLRIAARFFDKAARGYQNPKPWKDPRRSPADRQTWRDAEPYSMNPGE